MSESKVFLEVDGGDGEYPVFKVLKYITSASNVEVGYVLHQSIPQPAKEWSADKFYDWFEAMCLGRKYGLEIRHLMWDEKWKLATGADDWGVNHFMYEQKWQLRKPKSIDDKLREILTKKLAGNEDKEAVIISTVQAIKDVFKEQDAYWKRMEI